MYTVTFDFINIFTSFPGKRCFHIESCCSIFQDKGTTFLSCPAEATRSFGLSCLVLLSLGLLKWNQLQICFWLLATEVVIGLHNVPGEYCLYAKRGMDTQNHWNRTLCWIFKTIPTKQNATRLGNTIQYEEAPRQARTTHTPTPSFGRNTVYFISGCVC